MKIVTMTLHMENNLSRALRPVHKTHPSMRRRRQNRTKVNAKRQDHRGAAPADGVEYPTSKIVTDIANKCMTEALASKEELPSQDTPLMRLMMRQEASTVVKQKAEESPVAIDRKKGKKNSAGHFYYLTKTLEK
ncbi:hypothetical protein LINGRAHAP2_LOCUS4858 [Linum grandiflorum]